MALRGLVVGCGHMGSLHLRRLSDLPDLMLEALDPPRGLFPSGGDPDFVVIASPTRLHREHALPFLERGIPCLIEKPIADKLDDAALLASYPLCMPAHVERFNPVISLLRPGEPLLLQAERIAPPTGRSRDLDVVRDLMVHDIDLCLYLIGEEPVEIRALGLSPGAQNALAGAPDIARVRFQWRQGQVAELSASRVSRQALRTLRVFTRQEYFSLDLKERRASRIAFAEGALDPQELPVPQEDSLGREHRALIRAVRGEAPFPIRPVDGLAAVRLTLDVLHAIAEHAALVEMARTTPFDPTLEHLR